MEEKYIEALLDAREQVDSILLLSNLVEASIENDTIEKVWDLYSVFNIMKILSEKALNNLQQIEY